MNELYCSAMLFFAAYISDVKCRYDRAQLGGSQLQAFALVRAEQVGSWFYQMSLTFRSSCIPPSLSICDLTNTSFGLELRYLQFNKLFKYILCISNVCSIQEICKVENAKQRKHASVQSAHDLLFFLWVNQCIQLLHIPCTFFMLCS